MSSIVFKADKKRVIFKFVLGFIYLATILVIPSVIDYLLAPQDSQKTTMTFWVTLAVVCIQVLLDYLSKLFGLEGVIQYIRMHIKRKREINKIAETLLTHCDTVQSTEAFFKGLHTALNQKLPFNLYLERNDNITGITHFFYKCCLALSHPAFRSFAINWKRRRS